MALIDWGAYGGEEVERAIATFICLEYPDAVRIRASRGDRGIDVIRVLDDGKACVYQVKRFASNLTAKMKRQIEESWLALAKYRERDGLELGEWHLVMPLDPTVENKKWFEELTAGSEAKCYWDGLSRISGWTAAMPCVVDYYFNGCAVEIEAIVTRMLKAIGESYPTAQVLVEKLGNIQEVLNELNPNYRFEFSYGVDRDVNEILDRAPRPGVVMSVIRQMQGRSVQIDVISKHAGATVLSPISGKISIDAADNTQVDSIMSFLEYGTPIKDVPASIEMNEIPKFISGFEFGKGRLATKGSCLEKSMTFLIANSWGEELEIVQRSAYRGSRGAIWQGSSKDESISMSIKADYIDEKTKVSIKHDLCFLRKTSLSDARRRLAFLLSLGEKGVWLGCKEIGLDFFPIGHLNVDVDRISKLNELANLLLSIDRVSNKPIPFPETVGAEDLINLRRIATIVEGGEAKGRWESLDVADPQTDYPEGTYHIVLVRPLLLDFERDRFECGYVQLHLVGDWVRGRHAFVPTKECGGVVAIKYLGRSGAEGASFDSFYIAPAEDSKLETN